MSEKLGIITFHASYNCGSMLQAYALQTYLSKKGFDSEMIDFSSKGQKEFYSLYTPNASLKYVFRNLVIWLHRKRIKTVYEQYEDFKGKYFVLSKKSYSDNAEIEDSYSSVIAGSDQIWNTTIKDYDDAYLLNWCVNAKKIAYAASFGARNPAKYAKDIIGFKELLNGFDHISIRENNGKKWIEELIGRSVPVVLDPTLLLTKDDYSKIVSDDLQLPDKYIFYYSPTYSIQNNRFVIRIAKKYKLPVIVFNSKSYYLRGMQYFGFELPKHENPSAYLKIMSRAALVITTSFHGSIFSTIYKKKFWVIKNGGMFEEDDRVATLLNELSLVNRLIIPEFDEKMDYMQSVDYQKSDIQLKSLKSLSEEYLMDALGGSNEKGK